MANALKTKFTILNYKLVINANKMRSILSPQATVYANLVSTEFQVFAVDVLPDSDMMALIKYASHFAALMKYIKMAPAFVQQDSTKSTVPALPAHKNTYTTPTIPTANQSAPQDKSIPEHPKAVYAKTDSTEFKAYAPNANNGKFTTLLFKPATTSVKLDKFILSNTIHVFALKATI